MPETGTISPLRKGTCPGGFLDFGDGTILFSKNKLQHGELRQA
jgi:hypothetical protein